jgi:hypothetical protein
VRKRKTIVSTDLSLCCDAIENLGRFHTLMNVYADYKRHRNECKWSELGQSRIELTLAVN